MSLGSRAPMSTRTTRNGWAEVDLTRVNAYTIPFTVHRHRRRQRARAPADDQTAHALRSAGLGAVEPRRSPIPGRVPGVPALDGDYHTVEFAHEPALPRQVAAAHLVRAHLGRRLPRHHHRHGASTSSARPTSAITGAGNVIWQPNRRRLGRQETTFWNYKVLGRYVFPYAVGVSGLVQAAERLQLGAEHERGAAERRQPSRS